MQTVRDFVEEIKNESKKDLKLQDFIRQERARVEEFYKKRFEMLIDSEKIKRNEQSLHAGF